MEQFAASEALSNPSLSPYDLMEIAKEHPQLRVRVAGHPAAYPALLDWLDQVGTPDVKAAVAARRGSQQAQVGQSGLGATPFAAPTANSVPSFGATSGGAQSFVAGVPATPVTPAFPTPPTTIQTFPTTQAPSSSQFASPTDGHPVIPAMVSPADGHPIIPALEPLQPFSENPNRDVSATVRRSDLDGYDSSTGPMLSPIFSADASANNLFANADGSLAQPRDGSGKRNRWGKGANDSRSEDYDEDEEQKSTKLPLIISVGVLVLGLIAGAVWWFFLKEVPYTPVTSDQFSTLASQSLPSRAGFAAFTTADPVAPQCPVEQEAYSHMVRIADPNQSNPQGVSLKLFETNEWALEYAKQLMTCWEQNGMSQKVVAVVSEVVDEVSIFDATLRGDNGSTNAFHYAVYREIFVMASRGNTFEPWPEWLKDTFKPAVDEAAPA